MYTKFHLCKDMNDLVEFLGELEYEVLSVKTVDAEVDGEVYKYEVQYK